MGHTASILDMARVWGWVFWLVCLLALYSLTRRWVRRGQEAGMVRITARTSRGICFALLFIFFGFISGPPDKGTAVLGACIGGAFLGLRVGREQTKKYEAQLKSEGRLAERPNEATYWSRLMQRHHLKLFLAMFATLVALYHLGGRWRGFVILLCPVGMGLGGGYFLAVSAYTWLWARRKEGQGFRPLVLSIPRQ